MGGAPGVLLRNTGIRLKPDPQSESSKSIPAEPPQPSDLRERNEYLVKHHPVCMLHLCPNRHSNAMTATTHWSDLEDNRISMPYTYTSSIMFYDNHMKEELFYKWGFLGFKITANDDCRHEIKTLASQKKSYEKSRQCIYKQRHNLAVKIPCSKSYGLSSSHVWVWELDHKEGRVPKNWCFWTVLLEKTHESPLNCKEIKPINPKGNQPEDSLEGLKRVTEDEMVA